MRRNSLHTADGLHSLANSGSAPNVHLLSDPDSVGAQLQSDGDAFAHVARVQHVSHRAMHCLRIQDAQDTREL